MKVDDSRDELAREVVETIKALKQVVAEISEALWLDQDRSSRESS